MYVLVPEMLELNLWGLLEGVIYNLEMKPSLNGVFGEERGKHW